MANGAVVAREEAALAPARTWWPSTPKESAPLLPATSGSPLVPCGSPNAGASPGMPSPAVACQLAGLSLGVAVPWASPPSLGRSLSHASRPCAPARPRCTPPAPTEAPSSASSAAARLGTAVAAVQWDEAAGVRRLRFVARSGAESDLRPSGEEPGWPASGELTLEFGEYVRLVRGRADVQDGRVADWVTLVTSRLRSVTVGEQGARASPSFSFIAAAGREIYGITAGVSGALGGVLQRLAVAEDGAVGGDSRSGPVAVACHPAPRGTVEHTSMGARRSTAPALR